MELVLGWPLNVNLGDNRTVLNGNIANNLPATTTINGGASNSDSFISSWAKDFNGRLTLNHLGDIELGVAKEFRGDLTAANPARIHSLGVGGSVNVGSSIAAQQIDVLNIGVNLNINLTLPGIAGSPAGTNALGTATIGGSLPQAVTLTAASIGSLAVGTNASLPAGSHNLAGVVNVTPGNLGTLTVGPDGSITTTAQVNVAGDLTTMTMQGARPNVGQVMAGVITVGGTLGTGSIAGGTPGLFVAGHVGTIGTYGGFGPVVLRVIEAGVQRWLEEDPAGQVFSQPNAAGTALTPGKSGYVNTQYLYESAGFSSPQISARITNGVGTAPDQFDLSTVVFKDGASFNLDRLDASGVSGIRNVAVEGNLLSTLSPTARNFFLLPGGTPDPSPTGVYLPSDHLASVSVRDYAPKSSVVAAAIQGIAFGSFTGTGGQVVPGSQAVVSDANTLLGAGTAVVQAGSVSGKGTETFRVPFAALPGQQVAFFLDTAAAGGAFDPAIVVLTLQSKSDGVNPAVTFPATRGAVTTLIGVNASPAGSVVQTVAFHGDGGSMLSGQFVAQSITSTGPLGDLTITSPQGLNDVTAPSIFGSIESAGTIFGTIQTTGVRTDPVTGAVTQVAADLGRVFVAPPGGRNPQPYVTATTIEGQGVNSFTGSVVSRGNLVSAIRSDGGATGLVASQGDLGAVSTLLGTPISVGGVTVNGGFSGRVIVLGNDYGDLNFHGGLTAVSAFTGTGTLASGSNTVTNVGNTTGLVVGELITGTGIPSGTVIVRIDGSHGTVTLSQNATVSGPQTLTTLGTAGRIAVAGRGAAPSGILGNVLVDRGFYSYGGMSAGSAVVSGGSLGVAASKTKLSVEDGNAGIVAALGPINQGTPSVGGSVFNNAGATPGGANAAAIDAIFGSVDTTFTGVLTSGTNVVTNVSAKTWPAVGQPVTGKGIPSGTVVLNVDTSSGTVTLSKSATASGSQTLSAPGFDLNGQDLKGLASILTRLAALQVGPDGNLKD